MLNRHFTVFVSLFSLFFEEPMFLIYVKLNKSWLKLLKCLLNQILEFTFLVLMLLANENYGKIMRCALFEILYLTEVYLVTD